MLRRAKRRFDTLDFYPWLFRVPGFRRSHGYELGPLILTRRPLELVHDDLVVHVWQSQHRPLRMWLSDLWHGYRDNEHEIEAREAVRRTRTI